MTTETPRPIEIGRPGTGRSLRRVLSYLRPYKYLVIGSYALMLAINGISLSMPLIIRSIVDQGIRGGDAGVIRLGAGALMVLTLIRGVITFLTGRWTEVASQNVAYDLRNEVHDRLQSLSFSYHDRAETGQLLSRAVGDVDRMRFLSGRAILRLAEVLTLVLGIAVSMLIMNARLALPTLAIVPFLAYGALDLGRRYRPISRAVQQQEARLTSQLEQNLRGARIVKAFAQERAEARRFEEQIGRLFNLNMTTARMRAIQLPLLRLIGSAGTIIILLYGGRMVIAGQLTLGELVAFSTYVAQLLIPVRRLGMVIAAIAQSSAAAERVFEILDARSEVADMPDAQRLDDVRGHIQLERVGLAYSREYQVLKDISFEAKPGEVVALLGATGSGKSSVINLIPRFYDPTDGRILLDGRDIRQVELASLREQIGVVMQDTMLFATTIRENIAFGRPEANEEEVMAAAQAASAHEFIMALPKGYDTEVGERGVTLSGGQKQRLAIARALLKDPRILILDDATSSVDTETEALIQAALARLMEGRTSFVIAQRLSTVRQADLVLVLERGRIAARGRRDGHHTAHDELLRTSGLYGEIYNRQLRPRERERTRRKDGGE